MSSCCRKTVFIWSTPVSDYPPQNSRCVRTACETDRAGQHSISPVRRRQRLVAQQTGIPCSGGLAHPPILLGMAFTSQATLKRRSVRGALPNMESFSGYCLSNFLGTLAGCEPGTEEDESNARNQSNAWSHYFFFTSAVLR